jgi:hypothetical protein
MDTGIFKGCKKVHMKIQNHPMMYETASCVYILHIGSRFLIVKGKTLAGSIFLIDHGYALFLAGGPNLPGLRGRGQKPQDGKNTYYYPLYRYLKKHLQVECSIEIIVEDQNATRLLLMESYLLEQFFSNKKCLNSNPEPYIPRYNKKTRKYGWISRRDYSTYKSLRNLEFSPVPAMP